MPVTNTIGVNRAGNPAFGLFPIFPHFCENFPHFGLHFEITKIAEKRNNVSCTETFVQKSSAKTSMVATPCY